MYKLHDKHELWYVDEEYTSWAELLHALANHVIDFERSGAYTEGIVLEHRYDAELDDIVYFATLDVDASFRREI